MFCFEDAHEAVGALRRAREPTEQARAADHAGKAIHANADGGNSKIRKALNRLPVGARRIHRDEVRALGNDSLHVGVESVADIRHVNHRWGILVPLSPTDDGTLGADREQQFGNRRQQGNDSTRGCLEGHRPPEVVDDATLTTHITTTACGGSNRRNDIQQFGLHGKKQKRSLLTCARMVSVGAGGSTTLPRGCHSGANGDVSWLRAIGFAFPVSQWRCEPTSRSPLQWRGRTGLAPVSVYPRSPNFNCSCKPSVQRRVAQELRSIRS